MTSPSSKRDEVVGYFVHLAVAFAPALIGGIAGAVIFTIFGVPDIGCS